jgi:enoyl-CoA hydratase/carnithine racemase
LDYEQILYEVSDGIATISLNRPDKLNAWTMRMGAEVRHAFFRADRDPDVRVIVITGSGKGYCAGADMDMLQGLGKGNAEGLSAGLEALQVEADPDVPEAFQGEYAYPLGLHKPVIAAVNGAAAGLGLSYMLYYGLVAEHGSSWLLPRLVGMANACDLLYSGRIIDAQEALRMGLVNQVVPHDSLSSHVREIALQMATHSSPRSLRIMKRQLYSNLFVDLEASIREADEEMVASFVTEDFREGVASFVQRRDPRFTGK